MQQRYLYMKPALQPSEAVLLPALPRRRWMEPLVVEPAHSVPDGGFVPVTGDWNGQTTALSTRVRSCGSMAGRGILRAVGAMGNPYPSRNGSASQRTSRRTRMAQRVR